MPKGKKVSAGAADAEIAADAVVEAAPAVKPAARRKAPAKPAVPEEQVVIQFGGGEWNLSELQEKAIAQFVAEGHQRGRIKKSTFYVKPEERMLYYVFNDKVAGGVDFG